MNIYENDLKKIKSEFVKLQTLNIDLSIDVQIFNHQSDGSIPNYSVSFFVKKGKGMADTHIANFSRLGHIYQSCNRYDDYFNKNPYKYSREFNAHENKNFADAVKLLEDKINDFYVPSKKEMQRLN